MGKKCGEVKKMRKITFLLGQEDKVVSDLKSVDGEEMIKFFTDLVANRPDCYCQVKRNKKEVNQMQEKVELEKPRDEEVNSKPPEKIDSTGSSGKHPLRSEIVFGLTEVLKKVQQKKLLGVVVNDPLTIHLQATLFDLCRQFNVPFLLCKNLDKIANILKLSRLTCFAFSEKVKESISLCHPLHQIFLKQTETTLSFQDQSNPCLKPKDLNDVNMEKPQVKFTFDLPPEENFWISSEETMDSTMNNPQQIEGNRKLDEYIKVDRVVNYFPPRPFLREIKLELPWIGGEEEKRKIQKLGRNLFVVKSKLDRKTFSLAEEMPFSEPKTIQLPVSGRKKEKRRKFKKFHQDPRQKKNTQKKQ